MCVQIDDLHRCVIRSGFDWKSSASVVVVAGFVTGCREDDPLPKVTPMQDGMLGPHWPISDLVIS
jgi:hypothetical protein